MTIPESASSSPTTRAGENTIEVKLQEFEQLFNTIDPSPFHEKDLDHDLEEFIESWAKEYPLHEPLRLIVHLEKRLPDADPQAIIERAVHNYFGYKTALNQREFTQLMREGRLFADWFVIPNGMSERRSTCARPPYPWRDYRGSEFNHRRLGRNVASDGHLSLRLVAVATYGEGFSQAQHYAGGGAIFIGFCAVEPRG
jgi:hypothetical protein